MVTGVKRIAQFNFLLQDDYQLNQKVTLNMGLRYQYDTSPTESHGRIQNFNLATGQLDPVGTKLLHAPATNFGPRIGIAYSPFASNRTVVRAGYGVFHASLNAATAQNIPNNISQQSASITVFDDPNLRGFPLPDFNFRALTNITALPKDPKAAYMQHWNLNIQQGLGDQAMLQVAYLGNRGLHLSGGQNLNRFIWGLHTKLPKQGLTDSGISCRIVM